MSDDPRLKADNNAPLRPLPGLGGGAAGKQQSGEEFLSYQNLLQKQKAKKGTIAPMQVLQEEQAAARREAERLVREAEEQAAEITRVAAIQGFEQGLVEGRAQGRQDLDDRIRQLEAVLREAAGERERLGSYYREELVVLVKTAVERLVHHAVVMQPGVIEACLREGMQYLVENAVVRARLNPDDYARIMESGFVGASFLQGATTIQLMEDQEISAGGCFLQTDFGDVDLTVESCRQKLFAAIDRAFQAAVKNSRAAGRQDAVE